MHRGKSNQLRWVFTEPAEAYKVDGGVCRVGAFSKIHKLSFRVEYKVFYV